MPAVGQVCISIDLELAWGVWDTLTPAYLADCLALERSISQRLLRIFEHHDVPATWAIVGHLLEERKDVARSVLPAWYAPDIIDDIQRSRVPHEIGSHSFAHPNFAALTRAEAIADLQRAKEAHARRGLPYRSFVYPRNQVGHIDALQESGIAIYRSTDRGWQSRVHGHRLKRLAHLASHAIPVAPPTVELVHHDRIVESPSSMLLIGRGGVRRFLRPEVIAFRAARAMDHAARTGELFHLWFHPSNFYKDSAVQYALLETILRRACRGRDHGELRIVPMQDLTR